MNNLITIDGPAGSGKSTVARKVAQKLGYTFLDTGAYFRALTLGADAAGVELSDENAVTGYFDGVEISFNGESTFLNGEDVSSKIRTAELASKVSPVAGMPGVRERMVRLWRDFAADRDVVAEGRDQGSIVFPDAEFKFYLDASIEERVRRRHRELVEKNMPVDLDELAAQIAERDRIDTERKVAPLVMPGDAVRIDTTGLGIEEVVEIIVRTVTAGD